MLFAIGATHIEAFGDSLLVVQLISKVFQCFDESLHVYLDKCLDIISTLDYFSIAHIYIDMIIGDSWLSKHPATTSVMVYCTSINSRCLFLPT